MKSFWIQTPCSDLKHSIQISMCQLHNLWFIWVMAYAHHPSAILSPNTLQPSLSFIHLLSHNKRYERGYEIYALQCHWEVSMLYSGTLLEGWGSIPQQNTAPLPQASGSYRNNIARIFEAKHFKRLFDLFPLCQAYTECHGQWQWSPGSLNTILHSIKCKDQKLHLDFGHSCSLVYHFQSQMQN